MSAARNAAAFQSRQLFLLFGAVVVALTLSARHGSQGATTYEVVHAFSGEESSSRSSLVAGPDGRLFGTVANGGQFGQGALYAAERQPDGTLTVQTLHEFTGPDGTSLSGGLTVGPDGRLYGTSFNGGALGFGAVFAFDPASGDVDVLASFTSVNGNPNAGVIVGSDGALYGGAGTQRIFQLTTAGTLSILATFTPATHGLSPRNPIAEAADGNLYVATASGGPNSRGTILRVPKTGGLTPIFAFTAATGSPAAGLLRATDGYLYGATNSGGTSGGGILFRLDLNGAFETLHNFSSATGTNPGGALIEAADGFLYGSTTSGGSAGRGVIFKIAQGSTPSYTVVQPLQANLGSIDSRLMQTVHGDFYATTAAQFSTPGGILRMTFASDSVARVHTFTRSAIKLPVGLPSRAGDGSLFGASHQGGTDDAGTIYKIDPGGGASVVRSATFGATPTSGVLLAADGRLYGTAANGRSVYRVNVDGTGHTVLFTLPGFSGTTSNGGLIQTADGTIWGSAMFGGTLAHGLIFRIAPTGAVSVVHEFPGGAGGMRPGSELLAASDGFLYGTTVGDQTTSRGTVYRIDSLGTVATLHSFTGPDGSTPLGGLAEGPDGALYGMTNGGGTFNRGVLFKVVGGGVTKLLDLTSTTGGAPRGSLARSSDGRLYGLTQSGGAFNSGTLIRLNVATGQLRVLHDLPTATISHERLFEPAGQNALIGVEVFGPKRGGAILRFTPDRPPAGGADTFTTAEDTPLSVAAPGVLGNDTDEGSSLTAALVVPPPASHGSVVLNANGSFTFAPGPNFHGPTTFTYTAADALDTSDPVTVSISVTPVNDPPTVANASLTTDEDTPASGVAGWTDIDDAAVTFRVGANGTRGTATIDANSGTFIYTPNTNVHGADSFTIIATDGEVDSAAATITVAIAPVNDAPLAAPQSVATEEDVAKFVPLAATDVDGDPLTFVVGQAFKGSVTLSGSGATYVPLANFHGSDSFTYSVSDGQLSSAAAVTITVTAVNDAPIAAGLAVSTVEDRPVALTVWGSDLEGQALSYAIVTGPVNGSLSGTAPNFLYAPASNFRGSDSFSFKVNDGALDSTTATVSIAVTDEQFVLTSPEGASVQALAVNPVNSSILYAGAQRGFARSVDGGATWHRSTFKFEVSSIVVHPTTPTTLYSAGFDFGRVRRSTDGGATWQSLNAPGGDRLLIDPTRPDTLYAFAFAPNAISKTTNGGATWTSNASGLSANGQIIVSGAAIDPAVPSRLFVSVVNGGGVFRSIDSAASWQQVAFAGVGANDVDVDPRGTGVVYAVASGRVRRSPDAGNSWADVHAGITGTAVRADVGPDGAVYVTTSPGGVWVSVTGTGGWVRHTNTLPDTLVNVLVADPTSAGTVYAANAAHIYKSTNTTQTWTVAQNGLSTLSPWAVLVDHADPQAVFTATSTGVFKSADGGSSWSPTLAVTSRSVAAIAQDPVDPQVLYMGESDNVRVHRSLNGGATWTAHTNGLGPNATILSLAVDPAGTVYAGVGTGGVYKSSDRGASWSQANGGLSSAGVYALVTTNTMPSTLYAGTTNGLFRSTDGAATWQPLTSGIGGFVRSIAVDPSNANVVYAVVAGGATGAYKSVNAGATWTKLPLSLGSSGFSAIVVDPANPSTVYAATTGAQGVARSPDGGASWQTMTAGLPTTEIVSLGIGSDSSLYAGLITGGLWKYVRAVNDPPSAQSQSVTTAEDTPRPVTLAATDADGEAVTFAIVDGPLHGTLSGVAPNVTYTPAPNYHGPDQFTFTASDGRATSDTATVSITVTSVNDAPIAVNDAFTTAEDTPATIRPVDNDSDAEPAPIVINAFTQPAHGIVTQPGTQTLLYTPEANFFGEDTFTYTIIDGAGATGTATVTMTVTAVNDAPVASSMAVATGEDTLVSGTVVAADVDGPSLTFATAQQPRRGRVTLNAATGAFSYTPNANATGADAFSVTASDGSLVSNSAIVSVTISAVNDTPAAHGLALIVLEDRAKPFVLPASDPEGEILTFNIVAPPVHGTLSGTAPNLTYTPASNYNGPDTFTFSATDGTATSAAATVSIDVTREVWDANGPDTGYVVAVDRHPADPSVVFARSETTAWKSLNGGQSWTALQPGIQTLALVADPRSPLVLYASSGQGVRKSTDGGTTWVGQSSGLPAGGLQALAVDPVSGAVYAATNAGLYRSTNEAATWTKASVSASGFQLVWIDPVVTSRLYARINGTLWKSVDGGGAWSSIQAAFGTTPVYDIAIDPTTSDTLYASAFGVGVLKSVNGGDAWTAHNTGLTVGYPMRAIEIDPTAPGTLWVAAEYALYKTTNGGATWASVNPGNNARGFVALGAHPSQADSVFVGGSTGLFSTANGGITWARSNDGLSAAYITATAANPPGGSFLASAYYGGIYKSQATTWSLSFSTDGPVALAVDPFTPSRALAGHTCSGLTRTMDGGATWSFVTTGFSSSCVMSLAFHPVTPGLVYAGLSNGWIYRSLDGGATWSFLATVPSSNVSRIVFDPATPSTMYAGASSGVFKSVNAGAAWAGVTSGFSSLRALTIDSQDGNTLYVAGFNGVFRSTDAGATWTNAGLALPTEALTLDATTRDLYAGTSTGVMRRSATGAWTPLTTKGLIVANILSLDFISGQLIAGTRNGGVAVLASAANDKPVTNDQAVTTAEDTAVSVPLTAVDPDGEPLTFSIVAGPSHGSLSGSGASVIYTPAPNYNGPDSFTFSASDGVEVSTAATVSITVTPANDAPTAVNGSLFTDEDVTATGILPGTDPDGQLLTFEIVTNGTKGTATITNAASGAFSYVPRANMNGPDSFTFKVSDGTAQSSVATVAVTIGAVNDAPVVRVGVVATEELVGVNGRFAATDVEGDPITFSISAQPLHGAVTITDSSTGEFSYAPNSGTIGYQPFTFTASDGTASTAASQMVFVAANSARWPGQTVRASVGTGGAQLTGGFRGSASADGRLVAFVTPNRRILVHDRQTLATVEASVSTTGAPANSAGSDNPAISADGGFVAFDSDATNLVASDTNANVDVFVRDLGTNQTVRVSIASDGSQGNGPSFRPAISADGRYVAFVSRATNLVPADTNGQDDVFVYDRTTSLLRRVSIATHGAEANNLLLCGTSSDGSFPCISISADGRYVSFASFASTLVPGDTNGFMDAFVHDLVAGETTRVSLASGGVQAVRGGDSPILSADGRFVVFASDSASLDPSSPDTNNETDIFVHDRVTSVTRRVSLADDGSQSNGSSQLPSISAGGRYVSFNSDASNLVGGDTNTLRDTFVRDVAAGRTSRVSVTGDGQSSEQRVRGASAITADGQFVAFWSDAANLVTGDSNAFSDVFLVGGVLVSPTSATIAQTGGSGAVNVSFVYPGTAWSAVANVAWITVTNQSNTFGSGTVTFVAARNTGLARTGTLTVAGQTITVSQQADTTPPTVSYTISPAPNASGWNNTNVTAGGAGTDAESDVVSIQCVGGSSTFTGAQQINFAWSTEGQTAFTCTATNGAGLTGSVSFTVRVDKTPPDLTIVTPAPVTYALHQVVTAAFQCADPVSGFTSCQSTVPFDAPIDTATAGSKSFTVSATDAAGNLASRTVAYTVAKGTPQVTVTGGTFVYNANPRPASGSAKGVLNEPLGPLTFTYNGVAAPPVNAGTYAVVASYAGNANYLAASATTTIDINKASTTVLLISTPQPSSFSQPVTLVATVMPVQPGAGAPTGIVQFFDGGVALGSAAVQSNGQAMLTTSGLSAGSHTLTASYSGDGNFVGTTGVPRIHSVASQTASTQTALSASPSPSSVNQGVVLTALVNPVSGSARPTGNVRFYDGNTQLGTATIVRVGANNQAQLSVSTLALGTHTLTAEYVGDGTMAASLSPPTGHTVYQGTAPTATTTSVSTSPNPSIAGQTVTLTATVTAGRRSQPTGTVVFYVNGVSVGSAVTNASGQASLPVSGLAIGSHTITAQYVGNATFAGSTGSWRHFVQ